MRRPDATARSGQALTDLSWAGFEARLDPTELAGKAGDEDAVWELYVTLSAGGIRRRRVRFVLDRAIRAVELPAGEDALARAVPTEANGVDLELRRAWAAVDGVRAAGRRRRPRWRARSGRTRRRRPSWRRSAARTPWRGGCR